jgi:asparagine synthase (glutamine-hydrolysing)
MVAKLARRGPDGEGLHCRRTGRRWAIAAWPSSTSANARASPCWMPNTGLALVFNGTIYNYPQLRAELIGKGHSFQSDGDTEVILRAYAEWATNCVARLHGAFAFAIWDGWPAPCSWRGTGSASSRFTTAWMPAPPLRLKPQALLAAGGSGGYRHRPEALHHHLTLHAVVPAPRTLLSGIAQAAASHRSCASTLQGRSQSRPTGR